MCTDYWVIMTWYWHMTTHFGCLFPPANHITSHWIHNTIVIFRYSITHHLCHLALEGNNTLWKYETVTDIQINVGGYLLIRYMESLRLMSSQAYTLLVSIRYLYFSWVVFFNWNIITDVKQYDFLSEKLQFPMFICGSVCNKQLCFYKENT